MTLEGAPGIGQGEADQARHSFLAGWFSRALRAAARPYRQDRGGQRSGCALVWERVDPASRKRARDRDAQDADDGLLSACLERAAGGVFGNQEAEADVRPGFGDCGVESVRLAAAVRDCEFERAFSRPYAGDAPRGRDLHEFESAGGAGEGCHRQGAGQEGCRNATCHASHGDGWGGREGRSTGKTTREAFSNSFGQPVTVRCRNQLILWRLEKVEDAWTDIGVSKPRHARDDVNVEMAEAWLLGEKNDVRSLATDDVPQSAARSGEQRSERRDRSGFQLVERLNVPARANDEPALKARPAVGKAPVLVEVDPLADRERLSIGLQVADLAAVHPPKLACRSRETRGKS